MRARLVAGFLAAGLFALVPGCGGRADKEQAESAVQETKKPVGAIEEAAKGFQSYGRTLSKAPGRAKATTATLSVQQAINSFAALEGRNPQSLQELIEKGYMDRLPEPPAGTKFSYDPASGKVSVVPK